SWHSRHLAESTFLSSGTGWVLAHAGDATRPRTNAMNQTFGGRARRKALGFCVVRLGTGGNMSTLCMCTSLALTAVKSHWPGRCCNLLNHSSFPRAPVVWLEFQQI